MVFIELFKIKIINNMYRKLILNLRNKLPISRTYSITQQDPTPTENIKNLNENTISTHKNELEIIPKTWTYPPKYKEPCQVWIENLDTIDETKLGMLELHPDIFAVKPRIDLVQQNVRWQQIYRYVSYAHTKSRFEVRGGGRKPWPQKGMGRARHGSIRSPLFKGGGVIHGPKSPTPHFYMLPYFKRVHGLNSVLSIKLAQDDLHVVNDLEIPTDDPKYIEELIGSRLWGPSVLFVNDLDIMPRNITAATDQIKHINLMPAYGLNVYSMLKHDTLVLTRSAINLIESKLLESLHKNNVAKVTGKFLVNQV